MHHRQLYELVGEYQQTGDVRRLMADSYELLRYLHDFGKAAMACRAVELVLLPGGTPDMQRDAIRGAELALKEADATLDVMGCHKVDGMTCGFAYFPGGFIECEVLTVYGWMGNTLCAARGDFREDYTDSGDVRSQWIQVEGPVDTVKAVAVPFVALVKAVLVLAVEAVRSARLED